MEISQDLNMKCNCLRKITSHFYVLLDVFFVSLYGNRCVESVSSYFDVVCGKRKTEHHPHSTVQ